MSNYYFVFLRKPKNFRDQRDDPFWEFGSFGCTGCHHNNLLHPNRAKFGKRDRLVFLQGGTLGVKIIGITPPITQHIVKSRNRRLGKIIELRWKNSYKPIPYVAAPKLIDNKKHTDFPIIWKDIERKKVKRPTNCGAVASVFRSRADAAPAGWVRELRKVFSKQTLPKIDTYADAIQSDSGGWNKNAVKNRWTTLAHRRKRYQEKLGDRACA